METIKPESIHFENYDIANLEDCLNFFDKICPRFFAENEREDYAAYLSKNSVIYKIEFYQEKVITAFGVRTDHNEERHELPGSWLSVFKNSGFGVKDDVICN
jgi:hypothetical protein